MAIGGRSQGGGRAESTGAPHCLAAALVPPVGHEDRPPLPPRGVPQRAPLSPLLPEVQRPRSSRGRFVQGGTSSPAPPSASSHNK